MKNQLNIDEVLENLSKIRGKGVKDKNCYIYVQFAKIMNNSV
jgi:hypothetical protein